MKQIKAGIIGFGYMGYFHYRRGQEVDGIEVVAVTDTDTEKCAEAETYGLKAYPDAESLVKDDDLDLIIICTPNDSHAALSRLALEAGKDVLSEKPVTMTVAELEETLQCAEENGRIFTAHQNRRWDQDYLVVKEVIGSGKIGQVTTIYSQTYGQRGVCFGWRADPVAGGGMLYDWGIHLIDQMLMLFAGQKIVRVSGRMRSILTPVVDDYFEAELEFEQDIVAHIAVGTFALQDLPRWFVFGDKGTLRLDDFSGTKGGMARIKGDVRGFDRVKADRVLGPSRTMAHLERENLETIDLPVVQGDTYAFYRNLIRAVAREEKVLVTAGEMLRDMRVVEAVMESSKTGKRMEVSI